MSVWSDSFSVVKRARMMGSFCSAVDGDVKLRPAVLEDTNHTLQFTCFMHVGVYARPL